MSTAATTHFAPAVATAAPRRFHARMAAVCAAVAFLGFAPTYWMPLVRGSLSVHPITHLHAFFFYSWVLLFWWQASAVAAGRLARHREVGVAGVALATGMLFVGMGMAVRTLRQSELAGVGASTRAFTIVPVLGILVFATLVGVAVLNVRRPDVHKRLMLVATISILHAGVGRWFVLFLAPEPILAGAPGSPPVAVTVLPGLVTDLLIVAAMVHDRRTRGSVHPAYWAGGAAVLAMQLLVVPLSQTAGWLRVTDWLLAVAP